MQKTTLKITEIKNNPNNPRLIKDDKFKKLVTSIQEFPEMLDTREVVVNQDKVILGGNMRFKAAKEAGIKEIPVKIVDWDEDKQRQFIIKDNVSGGEWDWDMLANEFDAQELDEWGLDTPDNWLDDEEDEEIKEDEAPEVDESTPAVSKFGEVYSLGRHRIMCGSSVEMDDADTLMNGSKVQMTFTDPPYGVSYQSNMRVKSEKFQVIKNDDVILDFMPIVQKYCEGFVYVCTTWRVYEIWAELFKKYYELSNVVIWDKGGGGMGDLLHTFSTDYEIILVSNNGKEIVGRRYGSVWELNNTDVTKMKKEELLDIAKDVQRHTSVWKLNKDSSSDYVHPTQKPVGLSAKAIKSSVNAGGIILDLFLGSGSTLIACEQTDRTCYGMELDPKYVDVIRKRYHKFVTGNEEGWEDGTPAV